MSGDVKISVEIRPAQFGDGVLFVMQRDGKTIVSHYIQACDVEAVEIFCLAVQERAAALSVEKAEVERLKRALSQAAQEIRFIRGALQSAGGDRDRLQRLEEALEDPAKWRTWR